MPGKSLPRRTLLKGVGTAIALPLLDSMIPAFTRAAVASLRVASAPHLSANAGALVCDDVLRALPAAERDGRSGRVVRQLFRVADELRLKGQAPNPQLLWSLQPELEILLTELRRRLC